jgi:hypothetical protein
VASATENRLVISRVVDTLRETMPTTADAHRNVSGAGVSINHAVDLIDQAINQHIVVIQKVRDALSELRPIMQGSSDPGAVAAIMWLDSAQDSLEDDLVKLKGIRDNLRKEVGKGAEIVTNLEDTGLKIRGAVSQLVGYGNTIA